uniref:Uncharacterized protein n=1 Tax=Glossina brevipalpis TaxID=37001 RepID=A0A1A9W9Y5_9MUSC
MKQRTEARFAGTIYMLDATQNTECYPHRRSYVGINEEIMWVSIGMGVTIAILITIALCYIAREKCQKRQREYYKKCANRTTKSATTTSNITTNNNAIKKTSRFDNDDINASTFNLSYDSVTGQPHYNYNDYIVAHDHHHQQQHNQHSLNRSSYQYVNNFHYQHSFFYHSHQRFVYELPEIEIFLPVFPNPIRDAVERQSQSSNHYDGFWNNRSWVLLPLKSH